MREFFLLEQAERTAKALTDRQAKIVRLYHAAGSRRLQVARDLRGPEEVQASLSLYRQATLFLARAAVVAQDEHADVDSLTIGPALDTLRASVTPGEPVPELSGAMTLLDSADPLLFDRMSPHDAEENAEMLERLGEWLARRVDPRTVHAIRAALTLRLAVAGVAFVALCAWAIVRISAPTNHARGKAAVSSSSAYGSTADAVVDGVKEDRFGLHTNNEPNASVTIDLGNEYKVSRVKVFGRADCCYEQSVPLTLEVSTDGTTFAGLATRAEPFSQSDPWVVAPPSAVARYVRLRTEHAAVLVLSEVEVYGKKK